MSVDYKMIGKRIKTKRSAIGLTQEKLAEKLDVSVGYISQIERGITKVSLGTLAEISSILGVDISYFVTGTATGGIGYMQDEFIKKFVQLAPNQRQQILAFMDVMLKFE
ncbi:MAG: helix-turn-helix domain-containing protein [Faecalibacterium sp.]|nr:helix-turn-helix domain-containing protein [Ruminococcus sp.]MCM1392572.1 helix-turn-helix domain-containing protein [Ruminococcus sp.]MCM1485774.1 helix-turn-helix domain-containing protein [Faecalibacterium sp.]